MTLTLTTLSDYQALPPLTARLLELLALISRPSRPYELAQMLARLTGEPQRTIPEIESHLTRLHGEGLISLEEHRPQALPLCAAVVVRELLLEGRQKIVARVVREVWGEVSKDQSAQGDVVSTARLRLELLLGEMEHTLASKRAWTRDPTRYQAALSGLFVPPYAQYATLIPPRTLEVALMLARAGQLGLMSLEGEAAELERERFLRELLPLHHAKGQLRSEELTFARSTQLAFNGEPREALKLINRDFLCSFITEIFADMLTLGGAQQVTARLHTHLKRIGYFDALRLSQRFGPQMMSEITQSQELSWVLMAQLPHISNAEVKDYCLLLKQLCLHTAGRRNTRYTYLLELYTQRLEGQRYSLRGVPQALSHASGEDQAFALCLSVFSEGGLELMWSDALTPESVRGEPRWIELELCHRLAGRREAGSREREVFTARREALSALTKLSPLTGPRDVGSGWRPALLSLTSVATYGTGPSPVEAIGEERLAWLVVHNERVWPHWELLAVHQGRTKGVWGKGRHVSSERLAQQSQTLPLTPQDRMVCESIEHTGSSYYDSRYKMDVIRALRALVGHPYVFSNDNERRPLKVVLGEPSIQVVEIKGVGWELRGHPELKSPSSTLIVQGRDDITIYDFSRRQSELLMALRERVRVPLEGERELRSALSVFGRHLLVSANLDLVGGGEGAQAEGGGARVIDADSRLRARLRREDRVGLSLTCVVCPIEGGQALTPGVGDLSLSARGAMGEALLCKRDLSAERERLRALEERLSAPALSEAGVKRLAEGRWESSTHLGSIALLMALEERVGESAGGLVIEWVSGAPLRLRRPAGPFRFKGSALTGELRSWFEVSGSLPIDGESALGLLELISGLSEDGRFVRLSGGDVLVLTQDLERQARTLRALTSAEGGDQLRAHRALAPLLDDALREGGAQVEGDEVWEGLRRMVGLVRARERGEPAGLSVSLRPYQLAGLHWLEERLELGLGACLADDMGLGKTVQALALLSQRSKLGASLVVTPTSLTRQWGAELERFTPKLKGHLLELRGRAEVVGGLKGGDVLIVSYGVLVEEMALICGRDWGTVVLDESQLIKNPETRRYQAVKALRAAGRVALSGTPVENRLEELWSLLSFLTPGLLGERRAFNERFALPIERDGDEGAREALRALTGPFILRRLKRDVLKELPPKTEVLVPVTFTEREALIYEGLRREAVENLERSRGAGQMSHVLIFAELMRLRQASCHPGLLREHLMTRPTLRALAEAEPGSAKLWAFWELLGRLRGEGERVLVFSQFVEHLGLIRGLLEEQSVPHLYLDGATSPTKRAGLVKRFQGGEGEVFLISLRAGGVGLNLTAATSVVHMDPWWNPAVEDQATDRAHRIGQGRPVTVYRLVTEGTVEERIYELHHQKRALADLVLQGTESPSAMDLSALLRLVSWE